MRFSAKALAIAGAIVWGGAVLVVSLINLAVPTYGASFLHGISSVYPGFHASRTGLDVLVGTVYGIADGAAGGCIFAWLYNWLLARVEHA